MITRAGFTSVWLPPPSDSVSPQGYLPRDLWSLNSAYGGEGELRELLHELRNQGLKAIADIVINHRCAHFQAGLLLKCLPFDARAHAPAAAARSAARQLLDVPSCAAIELARWHAEA